MTPPWRGRKMTISTVLKRAAKKPEPLSNKRAPSNTAGYIRKKLSTPLWSWTSRRTAKHMATMIAVVP